MCSAVNDGHRSSTATQKGVTPLQVILSAECGLNKGPFEIFGRCELPTSIRTVYEVKYGAEAPCQQFTRAAAFRAYASVSTRFEESTFFFGSSRSTRFSERASSLRRLEDSDDFRAASLESLDRTASIPMGDTPLYEQYRPYSRKVNNLGRSNRRRSRRKTANYRLLTRCGKLEDIRDGDKRVC